MIPPRPLAGTLLGLSCILAPPGVVVGQEALSGTRIWDDRQGYDEDAAAMVAGIHRFLDRTLDESASRRAQFWNIDNTSAQNWSASVEPNRARLRGLLGLVDPRADEPRMEVVATVDHAGPIASTSRFDVHAVRWEVFPRTFAEGLLLEPKGVVRAGVVVLGDADQAPEAVAGLDDALPPVSQVARLLAADGCRVVVPTLLDRSCTYSGNPEVRMTNLTHREWIWRQAFEIGRHPLGYEVETVSSALDWLSARPDASDLPLGVAGYGEGGLVSLLAAAVDPRILGCWVAGAYGQTRSVWEQPIDRDIFGFLAEFGDTELANLVIPRGLVVEACAGPAWTGPLPPVGDRSDAAPGSLDPRAGVAASLELSRRASDSETALPRGHRPVTVLVREEEDESSGWNAGDVARREFLNTLLGLREPVGAAVEVSAESWQGLRPLPAGSDRIRRLVEGWTEHTQQLVRASERRRAEVWSAADATSPESWAESVRPLRERFWDEVIGRFPPADQPLEPRTIQILDEPNYRGYAVELPVWRDVVATGVLLLPKDLQEGERRPVVVCQHGLEGTPEPIVDKGVDSVYHAYGAHLADRGYIVYAPQNPYKGHNEFRQLQRKAHPLKRSIFAVIVRQHERTLEWLKTLGSVDPERIAFYGLSYGGKTAMRVPALLEDYCLSICSADFNEWVVKCTNLDRPLSYMYTVEYDMYEWNLAGGFNYAEMADLIAPRPFQVERGHSDGVAPDEWIGYEFAKVRRRYDALGMEDRCDITYFNGPHEIRGDGTFRFLATQLDWPRGAEPIRDEDR